MCGICGYLGDFSSNELEKMTQAITHRGPDDFGYFETKGVGLGHRRLSIIDLAGGHQPMFNEDKSIALIFNGEIYNYRQLKKNLKDHRFQTESDSETIIHLYEEYGAGVVDHLKGMFAFAIWDARKKELFIARDRFGIKPLYYARTPRGLVFSSEIKSLLVLEDIKPKVCNTALSNYLTFRYVPEEETMFEGIYKLMPAHYMVIGAEKTRTHQYWRLKVRSHPEKSVPDYIDLLTDSLRQSVDERLMSEVPLGSFLSGGLDSSFIVAIMSQLVSRPINTFSVGFKDGGEYDESHFAQLVAEECNTNHHPFTAEANDINILKKVIWHLDEPLADAATIPTFMLSELSSKFVKVVLSGEGSDELLAGYDKYKVLLYGKRYLRAVPARPLLGLLGMFSESSRNIKAVRGLSFLSELKDIPGAYLQLASVFTPQEKLSLINKNYHDEICHAGQAWQIVNKYLVETRDDIKDFLNRLLYLDINTWLPNNVLLKNDKMTMAHSLEARVPFLDHEFAENVFGIPVGLKLKGTTEKFILKKALARHLPPQIYKRKKKGFTVPLHQWNNDNFRKMTGELFSRERIEDQGYFNYDYVRKLLTKDLSNIYYRRQFWALFVFQAWEDTFINTN